MGVDLLAAGAEAAVAARLAALKDEEARAAAMEDDALAEVVESLRLAMSRGCVQLALHRRVVPCMRSSTLLPQVTIIAQSTMTQA
eukprot:363662-Chlamydomonas_euryale.AAC.5